MIRPIFSDYPWATTRKRVIDRLTIIDLLGLLEYQSILEATREECESGSSKLEATELLFSYVLDAMGVPPEGEKKVFKGEHEAFIKECSFEREWFEEIFYSKYLLEKEEIGLTLEEVVATIEREVSENLRLHYK